VLPSFALIDIILFNVARVVEDVLFTHNLHTISCTNQPTKRKKKISKTSKRKSKKKKNIKTTLGTHKEIKRRKETK
jgi:hypothetical protein